MIKKRTALESLNTEKVSRKSKFIGRVLSLSALLLITGVVLAGCGTKESTPVAPKESEELAQTEEQAEAVDLAGKDLVIPLADISETASFFPVDIDGTRVEVVAVKAEDGSIRTAFNTCQVCYDSGRGYYVQKGDVLVCQNCGNQFPMDRVEVEAGGCNPWPIFDENKTVTEESITIPNTFLNEATVIFANWKGNY